MALTKPWAAAGLGGAPSPGPSASAAGSFAPSKAPDLTVASALLAALPAHDGWGLRVVATPALDDSASVRVPTTDGSALVQAWTPIEPAADAGGAAPPSYLARLGVGEPTGAIRFLGITSPSRDPVLDVRVSRIGPDVPAPRWLDVRLPVDDLGLGEWLLPPPWVGGGELDQWPAGSYRVDILRAGPIERFVVIVPPAMSRPGTVPLPLPLPIYQHDPGAGGGWPPGSGSGPEGFVVADGNAIPLPGLIGVPLDERGAWLAAGTADPSGTTAVVHGWVPSASGIGLRFPVGARSIEARLGRLAPDHVADLGHLRTGSVVTAAGEVPWAIVDAPDGGRFTPGSYRLDVSWRAGAGERTYTGSVHLELAPGPLGTVPRWLSSARGMSRWAGEIGFVVGIAGRIEGASTDTLMRLLAEQPDAAATTVENLGASCAGGVTAEAGDAVIGLVDTGIYAAADVRVVRLAAGGGRVDVPVRAVVEPVPGLVLVAPVDGAWAGGDYIATLSGRGWSQHWVICLTDVGAPPGARAPSSSAQAPSSSAPAGSSSAAP